MSNRELIFPLKSPRTTADLLETNISGLYVDPSNGSVWREVVLQDNMGAEHRRLQEVHLLRHRLQKPERYPVNPKTGHQLTGTTDSSLYFDAKTFALFSYAGLVDRLGDVFAVLLQVVALEDEDD